MRETVLYAREHGAWWLVPLVAVLLLLSFLVVVISGATPMIYTIF